jgi:TPR repeat protein
LSFRHSCPPPTFLLLLSSSGTRFATRFLEENYVAQDVPLALELASSCAHPDARWLAEVSADKHVQTKVDAERLFRALGDSDARALCFACVLSGRVDEAAMKRSAKLGFAFAHSMLAEEEEREARFGHAQKAAQQGERDGFFWLGCCLARGNGCQQDLPGAKQNFCLAVERSDVYAMAELGLLLDASDPQRWRLLGLAASLGNYWNFIFNFKIEVELFKSGASSAAAMYAIGKALRGNVNDEEETIFKSNSKFKERSGPAKEAIAFLRGPAPGCSRGGARMDKSGEETAGGERHSKAHRKHDLGNERGCFLQSLKKFPFES